MSASALALVPKRFSLYEHVRDVDGIADMVEALDAEDELTPEIAERLSAELCAAIAGTKSKIDRTTSVLMQFQAAEAAAKEERDRLDVRAKYFARQRERLELYCLAVLAASGRDRIDGDTSAIARRRNPPKVEVFDPSAIPSEFMRLPEPPPPPAAVPDKKALAAALKSACENCGGVGKLPCEHKNARKDDVKCPDCDEHGYDAACPECGGSGKQAVCGCKLVQDFRLVRS